MVGKFASVLYSKRVACAVKNLRYECVRDRTGMPRGRAVACESGPPPAWYSECLGSIVSYLVIIDEIIKRLGRFESTVLFSIKFKYFNYAVNSVN